MNNPFIEERFIYKGYPCVVLFMPMAFRTGYVGLPKTSKFYGKGFDDIPVDCHGGLTYGRNYLFGQDDKDTWWIGFDCAHCYDGFDLEKANKYFGNDKETQRVLSIMKDFHSMANAEHEFRTLDYVKKDCKHIVDQIIELEEGE